MLSKKIKLFTLVLILVFGSGLFLMLRKPSNYTEDIKWGITYSKFFAEKAGLDWQKTYLAILDDLGSKKIRLPVYWQFVEQKEGEYDFADLDWMMEEAEKRQVEIILVVGRKVPRWPECHIPDWARELDESEQQAKILKLIEVVVKRYRESDSLAVWQIENEPFLAFGECPALDVDFLDQEIKKTKSLDPKHPILITDSGEMSIWLRAAKRGDIFGTTMYRIIWNKHLKYFKYPLPPRFFWMKANLINLFYKDKPIIVCELQGEYWGPKQSYETPLALEMEHYPLEEFQQSLAYAKAVGFGEVYLWGVEWWYWLKEEHGDATYWEEAKTLLQQSD
ncbi:MAG: cellulase family glycosylhydrolase [Patescibacteria group bacterium]|nr:cellulase family glycosylhydrolase [Patescibacteria group bacterium]